MYIFGRGRYRVPFCASAMPMWKRKESGPYKLFSQMSSGVRVIRGRRHLMRVTRCRGFGNKETCTIGSHITLLRAISTLSLPFPQHGKGDELCHSVCPSPGGANTHTHHYSLYSPRLLTRMREPAPQLEKGNTSSQHELRACARRPRGRRDQDCHITDVIYLTQANRDSRSILENVYDVSKSRHGIEEAFLPCRAPLLFRAAPVLY
jgi:hypothetical protein